MSNREASCQRVVAVSTSESSDMPALGLSDEHLRDAMAEIARHVLRTGSRLVYGGDLSQHGFSELLFEIVARPPTCSRQCRGTCGCHQLFGMAGSYSNAHREA